MTYADNADKEADEEEQEDNYKEVAGAPLFKGLLFFIIKEAE